jgi:hypothetical protein
MSTTRRSFLKTIASLPFLAPLIASRSMAEPEKVSPTRTEYLLRSWGQPAKLCSGSEKLSDFHGCNVWMTAVEMINAGDNVVCVAGTKKYLVARSPNEKLGAFGMALQSGKPGDTIMVGIH